MFETVLSFHCARHIPCIALRTRRRSDPQSHLLQSPFRKSQLANMVKMFKTLAIAASAVVGLVSASTDLKEASQCGSVVEDIQV